LASPCDTCTSRTPAESAEAKKVLGFSDNRQDAALQAGHFNDFLQVLLTRAALLCAIEGAGPALDREIESPTPCSNALGFDRDDPGVRAEYMQQPEVQGQQPAPSPGHLRNILGYRIYYDLRRGWRFNNPNLEQLGLVRIAYQDLEELSNDAAWAGGAAQVLQAASPAERRRILRDVSSSCVRALHRLPLPRPHRARPACVPHELRQPARALGLHRRRASRAAKWFVTVARGRPRDEDRRNLEFLVIRLQPLQARAA
jgi:hypothetical protein